MKYLFFYYGFMFLALLITGIYDVFTDPLEGKWWISSNEQDWFENMVDILIIILAPIFVTSFLIACIIALFQKLKRWKREDWEEVAFTILSPLVAVFLLGLLFVPLDMAWRWRKND